jgi:hypothetical protein
MPRFKCVLPGGHAGAGKVRDFSITTPPLPDAVAALDYCIRRVGGWKKGQHRKGRPLPRPPYTPTIIPL